MIIRCIKWFFRGIPRQAIVVGSLLFIICSALAIWVWSVNQTTRDLVNKQHTEEVQRNHQTKAVRFEFCKQLETLKKNQRLDTIRDIGKLHNQIRAIKKYKANSVITQPLLDKALRDSQADIQAKTRRAKKLAAIGPYSISKNCRIFAEHPDLVIQKGA